MDSQESEEEVILLRKGSCFVNVDCRLLVSIAQYRTVEDAGPSQL